MVWNGLSQTKNNKINSFFFAEIFASIKNCFNFALANENNAEVAQLVEHNLAKVRVAGSSPVFRSASEKPRYS